MQQLILILAEHDTLELQAMGFKIVADTVCQVLRNLVAEFKRPALYKASTASLNDGSLYWVMPVTVHLSSLGHETLELQAMGSGIVVDCGLPVALET